MTTRAFVVKVEQAQMIAQAQQVAAQAQRDFALIVSAVAAGHVPDGAQLAAVDVVTGALTFHVESLPDAS